MKDKFINYFIRLIPDKMKTRIALSWREQLANQRHIFSQNGEDLILGRLFRSNDTGFFVDVGAHHPTRFSNTYRLYQRGWSGINIDAMPGSMKLFDEIRPRDKNLEVGVSEMVGELKYFIFNEPALNTFSAEEASKKNGMNDFKIVDTRLIDTYPLSEILDEHMPSSASLDYLNIDVEGFDQEVLRSNNWKKYQPKVISIETKEINGTLGNSPPFIFLKERGYSVAAIMYNTLIFTRNEISFNYPISLEN